MSHPPLSSSTRPASWKRTRIPEHSRKSDTTFATRPGSLQGSRSEGSPSSRYSEIVRAWITDWKEVLSGETVLTDLLAGLTVAAVALPLNVALAIAAGLPASAGIWAGAMGGLVAAFFGGSRLQATGSAAALNVMVAALVTRFGPQGAYAGAILVGILQLLISFTLLAGYVRYLPHVVLAGFTTGVGIKLLNAQLPELLDIDHSVLYLAQHLLDPTWLHDVSWSAVVCGFSSVYLMIVGKPWKRFPAALVGLALATFVSSYLGWELHRVGEIPSDLPVIRLPTLSAEQWLELLLACLPLALLAAVESLISAKAVDGMAPQLKPHHPDLEVFGQGLGNLASGLVGGPPVSGVIVRSSVNAQSGARTRLAAILHGLILLGSTLFIGKQLALVPVAALAGLLCVIGYRLVEIKELWHLIRTNRSEALSFVLAMAGVLSDHLMSGLLLAIAVQGWIHWRQRASRQRQALLATQVKAGIRAIVSSQELPKLKLKAQETRGHDENWERHVGERPEIHPSAYIHPNASVIGRVVLSPRVHVAAEASIRADEGTPFFLGTDTNIQDGVVLHALKGKWIQVGPEKWAIYVGRSVSAAHQALIHGPCFIGDHCFIGFKAVVHDSVLGDHCFVGIGATVVGVEVPAGRYIPHGSVIDSPEKVASLPLVQESHRHFNEDVVEVNMGLVEAYRAQATPLHFNVQTQLLTSSQKPELEVL